jgi:ATPase subunit of ABC transporter with duplicated ATPase domains
MSVRKLTSFSSSFFPSSTPLSNNRHNLSYSIFNPTTKRNDRKRAAAGKLPKATLESAGAASEKSPAAQGAAHDHAQPTRTSSSASSSQTVAPASPAQTDKDKNKAVGSESRSELGENEKYLLRDFTGVLRSGEMCLVLGRPGSGCTTFMKVRTISRAHVWRFSFRDEVRVY